MTTVTVKSNIQDVRKRLKGARKQVDNAARRALNRTGDQVKTQALRALAKETGVKQKDLRPYVRIKKASFTALTAEVIAEPRNFNIARFNSRQGKKGVIASPWKKRREFPGTFLIQGGRTAMVRVGKARLPIRPVWGPRITREFVQETVNSTMERTVATRFPINFKQQLRYALRRTGIKVE